MSDKVYCFPIFKRGFGVRAVSAESNISQLKISGVWQFCGTWHLRHIWQFFNFSKDQKVTPRVILGNEVQLLPRAHLITLTLKSVNQKKISKNKKKYNITDITNKFVLVEMYLLISLTSMLYLLKTAGQNASLHRTKSSSKLRKYEKNKNIIS